MITATVIPDPQSFVPGRLLRIWTAAHTTWDAVHAEGTANGVGVPPLVVVAAWAVSYSIVAGQPVVLHARTISTAPATAGETLTRHALDGTTYPTMADAQRAAFDAELIGFKVNDFDAARYGFPTEDLAVVDWRQVGRDAHAAGAVCAPALDVRVREAIRDLPVGGGAAGLMAAWSAGWREAQDETLVG